MNELVYVKDNYNVISACFIKNKKISSRLYDWYLPYYYLGKVYINEDIKISINGKVQKVRIINLTYHPSAESIYKPFPIVNNQPSWQVRYICKMLEMEGITYFRERCFKGLKNNDGKSLRVDISFQIDNTWHFIEYHGIHHYVKSGNTPKRFNNIKKIMEIKRAWCLKNKIPYLEIPFYKQNQIGQMLTNFLKNSGRSLHSNHK